tara:strand:- start:2243 stop:3349 length:1107 start_codon:yes stop_codon:yes gene_type:complete
MNRILKRPMFRRGGSANEGITSGLDTPRVNYSTGLNFDMAKVLQDTQQQVQNPEVQKAFTPYFQRPKGEGLNRFLTNFGLDLLSRPPQGGFFSTVAAAAKKPTQDLFDDIDAQRLGQQAGQADLFKTLLQGNIDIAAEAAGGSKGKSYAKLEIANNIEETMKEIVELEKKQANGEDVAQLIKEKKARLTFLTKEDAVGKSLMENKDFSKRVLFSIMAELKKEMIPDPNNPGQQVPKYKGDSDPDLLKEAYKKYEEFFIGVSDISSDQDQELAAGGRAGYNIGGMTETMTMQAPGMEMQETETMEQGPEDNMDYATLRARLPQEIGDDIVRLLSASPEALEDFATIATQQDVDQFNKKYSVNLVLPAEA